MAIGLTRHDGAMFRSGAAPCLPRAADRTFVLIIADDQAFGDFGFMGHPVIATPRLDRLAAEGVVFERGYVPSSLCRPSLMSMITGLPPHRHGVTGNDPPKGTPRAKMLAHIDAAETLPARLCAVGYRSLQTGKWWEGSYRRGGFTAGMTHGDPARGGRHGDDGLDIGRKTMQPIFDFVDADPAVPFFLWYAPMLPHAPHDPPERLLAKYTAPGRSLHLARYFAMCEWFDETCGALLDHLERRGLRDDTLVLFVVDNGWIQRPDHRGYAPRSKRSPYDGGVRTPIIVSWPGRLRPGRDPALVSSLDLAPTVLAACGATTMASLPGHDLVAVAAGREPPREEVCGEIFTHDVVDLDEPAASLLYRWVVRGEWKLIVPQRPEDAVELYQVATDPMEQHDLAREQPARVELLRRRLDRWWPGGVRQPPR